MKRAIIIVLDAVGIGELPDADKYGDCGSNTLMHVKAAVPSLELKNMCNLGLGLIDADGKNLYSKPEKLCGIYGKMSEHSAGKDTTTGHWEISGIWLDKPFPTYPNGFPQDVISAFEKAIGTKTLANRPASGTVIINELGDEHMKTGYPIVYTSADSVFQIAAHEDVISVDRLYEICEIARKQLTGEHGVGRVIARPFIGKNGNYTRTPRRKDFSLPPVHPTILDFAKQAGLEVAGVGKIEDIFCMQGITKSVHTTNNTAGIDQTIKFIKEDFGGIIFTNLVDTDMIYGHRNDVQGFAGALAEFDSRLPDIMSAMKDDDVLFITADHGCDPTTPSTDHSREYVFLLGYGKSLTPGSIGVRETFADVAKSIETYLGIKADVHGTSFL